MEACLQNVYNGVCLLDGLLLGISMICWIGVFDGVPIVMCFLDWRYFVVVLCCKNGLEWLLLAIGWM